MASWYDQYINDPYAGYMEPAWSSIPQTEAPMDTSFDDFISSMSDTEIDRLLSMPDADFSAYMADWGNELASGGGSGGGTNWSNIVDKGLSFLNSGAGSALAGGLLGSLNGAKQTGESTTTQAPWSAQQPYLLDMFQKAQQTQAGGAASMSPQERQALQTMGQVASGPTSNPYFGVDNPYLKGVIDNASQDVMRNLMPMMNRANIASGSFGNSGIAETFGRTAASELGKIATGTRFTDYTNQQQLGENAANRTTGMLGPLYSAGQNSAANPWANLANYGKAVTGSYGSQTTNPIYTNPTANVLGGALLGSQIYRNIGT